MPAEAQTIVIVWLQAQRTQAAREAMARYAIPADKALGVGMRALRGLNSAAVIERLRK